MSTAGTQAILGIEGGATRTRWALCRKSRDGMVVVESEGALGPGSTKLLTRAALKDLLSVMPKEAERVGVFLAGCATAADRKDLFALAREVWPTAVLCVGGDRESGFAAAFGDGDGVAVIAGTGSAVQGRCNGQEARAGGWGHLLGDSGGGYDLAIHALQKILFGYDTAGRLSPLASEVLRTLGLNTLTELSVWAQSAHKSELARLTPLIFEHADDPYAREVLEGGARILANLTASVVRRLECVPPVIRLIGGVFTGQTVYQKFFADALVQFYPDADIAVCTTPGSLGAVFLAGDLSELPAGREVTAVLDEPKLTESPTEQSNPRSESLSTLSVREAVELFVEEERYVQSALERAVAEITAATELVVTGFQRGGRLFYVGAGTSGRLGMLDASEMPPTFGVGPEMVQAIMAGGAGAFQRSAEGAEDSAEAGAQSVLSRGVTARDVVCGIAASGRTPFVLGALRQATAIGAGTIFLTCNPERSKTEKRAEVEIDLGAGPELITGSTRLKAGTATKVALNILTSVAMVRMGKVQGNLMACLQPTNAKLRDRATRIVATTLKVGLEEARDRLECAKWNIQAALSATGDLEKNNQIS